jgi:hypothetical protein
MNSVKTLCGILAVMLSLGLSTALFGQERCQPGQLETPPCAAAQLSTDEATALGQLETPPDSQRLDLVSTVEEALITLLMF